MTSGHEVFLSHSSSDAAVAREFHDDLEAAGFSCWIAPDDIDTSAPWASQIIAAVEACRVLLVLISAAANESAHVAREVNLATSRHKTVVPVRIEPIRPTGVLEFLLTLVQRVDAFPPPVRQHAPAVRAAIARVLEVRQVEAGRRTEPDVGAARDERRLVTLLAAELLPPAAARDERRDPEDLASELGPFRDCLTRTIARFGGSVERTIGDITTAAWGVPSAQEDAAERAVRASLSLVGDIHALARQLDSLLSIRVGIATAETLVRIDTGLEPGFEILAGDAGRVATTLARLASSGTALVDDRTHGLSSRRIAFTNGPGADGPLATWRPVEVLSRLGPDVPQLPASRLVGRELERAILVATFDRAVRDSSVQLVTLVGEPGIGKSRLVAELFAELEVRPALVAWRQGRCLPYGDGISFWALGEIVKAHAGILESDPTEVALRKLDAVIPTEFPDREWLRSRLGALIGAPTLPAGQEENFAAWRRFLEELAASRPTVLVFEDLHWADDALLDFLDGLGDRAREVPLLVLCTARPELLDRRSDWASRRRNAALIDLAQLTDADVGAMVRSLVGDVPVPDEAVRTVIERCGGNPLYAEEFARLVRERVEAGMDPGDLPFPDNLRALIAARLDTIPEAGRGAISDAAVIGKVFWSGGVAAVGGRDLASVRKLLDDLAVRDFIRAARTSSLADDEEFAFLHILVRDVAYGQIPRVARAAKHAAAAAWLESTLAGRAEDFADVLAHHYAQALELAAQGHSPERVATLRAGTRRYLLAAGDRALNLDVARAEASYARALALFEADEPERLPVLERWSNAAAQAGRLADATRTMHEVVQKYRRGSDAIALGRALTSLARLQSRIGEEGSLETSREAVAVLERAPAGPVLVEAYAQLAPGEGGIGNNAGAVAAADRAIELAVSLGMDPPPLAVGFRGLFRCLAGDAAGLDDLERGLERAIASGLGRETAVLYANIAYCVGLIHGPGRELPANERALEFARRTGNRDTGVSVASTQLTVLYDTGHWDEALAGTARTEGQLAAAIGAVDERQVHWVEARIAAYRGKLDVALEHAEWLLANLRAGTDVQWLANGWSSAAAAFAAGGQRERARSMLRDFEADPNARADQYQFLIALPELVRTAIAVIDEALAGRLAHDVRVTFPIHQAAIDAARATITEAAGDGRAAAAGYEAAVVGWRAQGNIPELGFALFGLGRCRTRLGGEGADPALREARAIFGRLGAEPIVGSIDAVSSCS